MKENNLNNLLQYFEDLIDSRIKHSWKISKIIDKPTIAEYLVFKRGIEQELITQRVDEWLEKLKAYSELFVAPLTLLLPGSIAKNIITEHFTYSILIFFEVDDYVIKLRTLRE